VIPTVNELRYAGTHLIDAFDGRARSIPQAIAHCHRGSYDSVEVLIQARLDHTNALLLRIESSDVEVNDIDVPGFAYWDLRNAVEGAQRLMQDRSQDVKARNESDHVKPDLDRGFLEKALQSLQVLEEQTSVVPRVHEVLKKKEAKLARSEKRAKITLALGIMALVVSATVGASTIWSHQRVADEAHQTQPAGKKSKKPSKTQAPQHP
jgi:hypothetical protein